METTTVNEILEVARLRGVTRATYDRADGIYNPSPLSGEWAGESIKELLGDLCDDDEIITYLCDEYEDGYESVFEIDEASQAIRESWS